MEDSQYISKNVRIWGSGNWTIINAYNVNDGNEQFPNSIHVSNGTVYVNGRRVFPTGNPSRGPSQRITFEVTEFPNLPDGFYVTLTLNDRDNDGTLIRTKILSSRDPELNKKTFSFDVQNPKESTITCKLKRTALFGLVKFTEKKQKTKLVNIGNKVIQLLTNFKVAVLRVQVIEPFDAQEKKMELANKKKKEERKLKERLEFCERNGIDPYVLFGSQ